MSNAAITTETVKFLEAAYYAYNASGKIKTYLSTLRERLELPYLSSPGIKERYSMYFTKFFERRFFNSTHNNSIYYTAVTQAQVDAACKVLAAGIKTAPYTVNAAMLKELDIRLDSTNQFYAACKGVITQAPTQPEPTTITIPAEITDDRIDASVQRFLDANGITLKVDTELVKIAADFKQQAKDLKAYATSTINDKVAEAVNQLRPMMITIGDRPAIIMEDRAHTGFNKALRLLVREMQIFVAGPAGTGKTTLAHQLAKAMNLPFGQISCTLGMSEAHLLGRMDAHGNYMSSSFVEVYENGGVFLFDEVDAADANTMLIVNSALANGILSVPSRKENPYARRAKNFYCVCAANTWGHGSNEYAGRNILDAAFLDRFAGSRMRVDYDTELETAIAGTHTDVLQAIHTIRQNVKANGIKRVVSTRAIISGVRAKMDGETLADFLAIFTEGWTPEEVRKAMQNVN